MEKRLKEQNIFSEYPMLFQIENKRVCHKSVTHLFYKAFPQKKNAFISSNEALR